MAEKEKGSINIALRNALDELKGEKSIIKVFLDDEEYPFGEFASPVKIRLDTTRMVDGKHTLKIVAKSTDGSEGIRIIPFEVKNGPTIAVVGLNDNDVVNEEFSVTINAYGSERKDKFIIVGSETPKAIPFWVWLMVIAFIAYGLYYIIMYWEPGLYESFF